MLDDVGCHFDRVLIRCLGNLISLVRTDSAYRVEPPRYLRFNRLGAVHEFHSGLAPSCGNMLGPQGRKRQNFLEIKGDQRGHS